MEELKKYSEWQTMLKQKIEQQDRLLYAVKSDITKRSGLVNYVI
jgi:hypothetical protein